MPKKTISIPDDPAFIVPSYDESKFAVIVWKPFLSKKKVPDPTDPTKFIEVEKWIPSTRYPTLAIYDTWEEYVAEFDPSQLQVVDEKGMAVALSMGIPVYGGKRSKRNVGHMSRSALLDLDGVEKSQGDEIKGRLRSWGINFFVYPTFSHRMPGKGERERLGICMDRETPIEEQPQFIRALMQLITGDAQGLIAADEKCVDAGRVFYGPSAAPGREHLYTLEAVTNGRALTHEEVYNAVGMSHVSVPVAEQTDEQRAATLKFARSISKSANTDFSKSDLTDIAKDKKAGLTSQQKAALQAAAKGERLVVVSGERRPTQLKQAATNGGDLCDVDIDAFLTSLMWKVAQRRPDAEPAKVQAAFAQSVRTLQEDDTLAGNTPYPDDALRTKFESGVEKINEDRIKTARASGTLTPEEHEAKYGNAAHVVKKVFLGDPGSGMVPYKVQLTADGPKIQPLSNFNMIPDRVIEGVFDKHGMASISYAVKITLNQGGTFDAILPLGVLTGNKPFLAWCNIPGASWRGSDQDVIDLRETFALYVKEHNIPRHPATHAVGVHYLNEKSSMLVLPQGTYQWKGGYAIERVETEGSPLFVEGDADAPDLCHPLLQADLRKRSVADFDIEAIKIFTENLTKMNTHEACASFVGVQALAPLKGLFNSLDYKAPYTSLEGEKGVGKTLMANLFRRAGGGLQVDLGDIPPYSLSTMCSGNWSFIVVADEYRAPISNRDHEKTKGIRGVVRANFDGASRTRASMRTIRLNAPLCVSGEQAVYGEGTSVDVATQQRALVVSMVKETLSPSNPLFHSVYAPAKDAIFALGNRLDDCGFGFLFQAYVAATWTRDLVQSWVDHFTPQVEAHFKTIGHTEVAPRIRKSITLVMLGDQIWNNWCAFLGVTPPPAATVAQIASGTIDAISHDRDEEEAGDPVGVFLEEVSVMLTQENSFGGMSNVPKFWQVEGDTLYVHVEGARKYYLEKKGDPNLVNNFWRFVNSSPLALEVSPGSKRPKQMRRDLRNYPLTKPRCMGASVSRLLAAGLELADAFTKDETVEDTEGSVFK